MKPPIWTLALALVAMLVAVPAVACDGLGSGITGINLTANDLGFQDVVSLRVNQDRPATRAVAARPVVTSNLSTRGLTTGKLVRQTVIADDGTVSYRMVPQQRIMAGAGAFRPSVQVLRRPASIEGGPAVLKRYRTDLVPVPRK